MKVVFVSCVVFVNFVIGGKYIFIIYYKQCTISQKLFYL